MGKGAQLQIKDERERQAVPFLHLRKSTPDTIRQPAQLALEGHAEAAVFAGFCDGSVDKLRRQSARPGDGHAPEESAGDHGGEEVAGAVAGAGVLCACEYILFGAIIIVEAHGIRVGGVARQEHRPGGDFQQLRRNLLTKFEVGAVFVWKPRQETPLGQIGDHQVGAGADLPVGIHHPGRKPRIELPVVGHGGIVDHKRASAEPVDELQGKLRLSLIRQIAREDAVKARADGLPVVEDRADAAA